MSASCLKIYATENFSVILSQATGAVYREVDLKYTYSSGATNHECVSSDGLWLQLGRPIGRFMSTIIYPSSCHCDLSRQAIEAVIGAANIGEIWAANIDVVAIVIVGVTIRVQAAPSFWCPQLVN